MKRRAAPADAMNAAQKEFIATQIERGLATRSHARIIRDACKDVSASLLTKIASGTAGLREANTVRRLLGLTMETTP